MKYHLSFLASVFSVFFLAGNISWAQPNQQLKPIQLRNMVLHPTENARQWLDSFNMSQASDRPHLVIIQFKTLPTDATHHRLEQGGVRLIQYLGQNSYIALIRTPVPAWTVSDISYVVALPPDLKIDERFKRIKTEIVHALVQWAPTATDADRQEALTQAGARVVSAQRSIGHRNKIRIAREALSLLARSPWVLYISPVVQDTALNLDERHASGAAWLQQAQGGLPGLSGAGVTVGIGDNATGLLHADLRDRVLNFNPAPPAFHGVHTSGTAASAGIINPVGQGMAPKTALLSHLFSLAWQETAPMRQDYNMTLTNNSYAAIVGDCDYSGTYDDYSAQLDELARTFPDVLHVFAAGNDGRLACANYPDGYRTVVGGYQAAKDVLVVGSIKKDISLHVGASRGPVRDGRIKPEIVTFGHNVFSTTQYDTYAFVNGTSMAAPGATGALALLSERYKQTHNNNPPAPLLKALLVNAATDIGNLGPDYAYGFGMMNARRAVDMLDSSRYALDSTSQGQTKTYTISTPANTAQLKVLLYWPDHAASPLAAHSLVNDLDLTVTTPGGQVLFPYVLDTIPAHVTDPATTGPDHLNNVEQVVVANPSAGNYLVTVSGFEAPMGPQPYVLVYDLIPIGVRLQNPVDGEAVLAGDSLRIYWEASNSAEPFTLSFSSDNGATWNVIDAAIPASDRTFRWPVPLTPSATCRLRLSRNNTTQSSTTGVFVISDQPMVQLAADQCPGYMAITWNPISGAVAYELLMASAGAMVPVDTVADTTYAFSGLSLNDRAYVAVRPLLSGGVPGMRSVAVSRIPNDGTCAGSIADNDLALTAIASPVSGRTGTSTSLGANTPLLVTVRNLDDQANANFLVHYRVNGGGWQTFQAPAPALANAETSLLAGVLDFSAEGNYWLDVVVQNLSASDPNRRNDTFRRLIRRLPNPPIDLNAGWLEDFEWPAMVRRRDEVGFAPNPQWDFETSTDTGRMRTFVSSEVTIAGEKSLSLDLDQELDAGNQNYLTATFNLAGFDTATTDARVEFAYRLHGKPKQLAGNQVWIRGNDLAPWITAFAVDTLAAPGSVQQTGSIPVSYLLRKGGQNLSASFSVRIGQFDTSCIATRDYGNGLTIDNFRLYSVQRDVQLLAIESPRPVNCGISANSPLRIVIYNSDNQAQQNVTLSYRADGGTIVTEVLPLINARDTIRYTFTQSPDFSALGLHLLDVWIAASGDTYRLNDSLLGNRVRHQAVVRTFPYFEDFESGSQNWYAEGTNSSWAIGKPSSPAINQAASGQVAWKTNLSGNYNDQEHSFLYSPCLDVSGLQQPMLSFSLAADLEHCEPILCDAAYVAYSYDGDTWIKLDSSKGAYHWYGNQGVWNTQDDTRWKVASVPLPVSTQPLRLRFEMHSDAGVAREGIAVDDIHVYDLQYPLFAGKIASGTTNAPASEWRALTSGGSIFAALQSAERQTSASLFRSDATTHPLVRQYFLPASLVITGDQLDSTRVRAYVTDDDVVQLLQDARCGDCPRVPDVYRLGVLTYRATNDEPNRSLLDNTWTGYRFSADTTLRWTPYDKGYHVETRIDDPSEIWFTTGIPNRPPGNLFIYPNPIVDQQMHLAWADASGGTITIKMLDVTGRTVLRQELPSAMGDSAATILLPNLPSGVYIIKAAIGDKLYEQKVVIQHR